MPPASPSGDRSTDRSRDRRAARRRRRARRRLALSALAAAAALLAALLASGGGSHARAHPLRRVAARHRGRGRGRARVAGGDYPETAAVRALIALGKPIYCGGHRGDEVALTFDDGPGPYTRLVLRKLRAQGVGATFFVVGRNIPLVPGATRQERALGAVGDHTFTHPLLTALGPAEATSEMVDTQAALARSSGGPVFLFRPPYGGLDETVLQIARAHAMLPILWTVDSADSLGANYAQIERNVVAGLRPGAIILMHENHGQTVRALPVIFGALRRKHLRAVSVTQLLTDDPPTPAQVRAGGNGCAPGSSPTRTG